MSVYARLLRHRWASRNLPRTIDLARYDMSKLLIFALGVLAVASGCGDGGETSSFDACGGNIMQSWDFVSAEVLLRRDRPGPGNKNWEKEEKLFRPKFHHKFPYYNLIYKNILLNQTLFLA